MINQANGRKVYLEILRIVAVLLVIYNYLPACTLYMESSGAKYFITLLLAVVTRVNVPTFLMISGALLLGREDDFVKVCRKRISRIVIVLVAFQSVLFLCRMLRTALAGDVFGEGPADLLRGILEGDLLEAGSYWYLYAYLGMLIMLPFLQRIAAKMQKTDIAVLILLHLVVYSVIPLINVFGKCSISISKDLSVPFAVEKVMFYPLLGYYLDHRLDFQKWDRKSWCYLSGAVLMGILLTCLCVSYQGRTAGSYSGAHIDLFDYVLTMAMFVSVKYLTEIRHAKLLCGKKAAAIVSVGQLTFGIYLLDPCIKALLYEKFAIGMETVLPTFFVSILWCGISFVLGGGVTWLLRKIPLVRRVL